MAIRKTTTRNTTTRKTPAKKSSSLGISIMGGNKTDMRKWEVESALSTLKRADEIRKNTKMMADVKKLAQEQVNVLNNFTKGK
jgi:hypothetical protein